MAVQYWAAVGKGVLGPPHIDILAVRSGPNQKRFIRNFHFPGAHASFNIFFGGKARKLRIYYYGVDNKYLGCSHICPLHL